MKMTREQAMEYSKKFENLAEKYEEECKEDPTREQIKVSLPMSNGKAYDRDIDILIAPLIQTLNEHGFHTRFCCSGHVYDKFNGFYIMFQNLKKDKRDELKNLVRTVPNIYIENATTIAPKDESKWCKFKITDPSKEEVCLLKSLINQRYGVESAYVAHYYTIRGGWFNEDFESQDAETNKEKLLEAVKILEERVKGEEK